MKTFTIPIICAILFLICSILYFIDHRILVGCVYLLLSFLWGLISHLDYKLNKKQKKGK